MKQKKNGRLLAVLLAVCLCAGVLGACGKDGASEDGPSGSGGGPSGQEKGRYVEKTAELPKELAEGAVAQVYAVENTLHLLVMREQDGKVRLEEWVCEDGAFREVTRDWLASMELPGADWVEAKLIQGPDDVQYLYAGYAAASPDGDASSGEEPAFTGHLWKGTAEGAVEITPEKWTVLDEQWGSYEMIQGLAALDNGTLLTLSYSSVDLLSGQDGTLLESEPLSDVFYEGNVVTDGANAYLCTSDESVGRVEKRKDGKKDGALTIPFPRGASDEGVFALGGSGSFSLDVLKDGTLIAAGETGIFRHAANAPEEEWEQLIAGMETDFSMSDCWCLNLAALENGGIYALFQTKDGQKLNFYEWDANAASEVTEVLKLYTVYENALLKQAAAMYHKAHPEVMIEIESEYSQYFEGIPDYDALYQKLNTMLMGENAPDLLAMDHLNAASYASRGLLEELSDVVNPLEESGELLSNVTGVYAGEDGKRYVVPLQFRFTLAMGRDVAPEDMSSLEALAGFLSQAGYSYLGSRTVEELVDLFYPYFCDKIVKDKQLDKEVLGRYLGYLKAIADNSGLIDRRPEEEACYGMWDLAAKAKLAFTDAAGFNDCMFPMSIVDYVKGDYTVFENSFIPSLQMGICARSKHTDTARDFLRFALSQQVQDVEISRGFPVNSLSLRRQADMDRSDMTAVTMIMADDGRYLQFESKPYSKETADRLVDVCRQLAVPVREDAKIREVLIEHLGGYLKGTASLEETIQKIEDGLKMYLAE